MQDESIQPDASNPRAVRDAIAAQKEAIELKKLQGALVDRKAAEAHVRLLARQFREGFMRFAEEVGPEIAEEFGADPDAVVERLARAVEARLEKVAGVKVDLAG
ncbi:hypothetical protein [Vannielia litorea]|uniref:hypothetical protein n=1 Tax=Vannielia litorea TaxID=1217970 RepID=UPI001BD02015|nr:hypothetical protein [Vannielia litorea]MBS8228417.1 hypothetical protein [Vannielia litorea]